MEILKVRPELKVFLKKVCEEQQITDFTITDIQTNQKGEGFLSEIYMIGVKDNNNNKHLDVIIKAALADENTRDIVPIQKCFENEIYYYRYVNKIYKKMEKENNIAEYPDLVPRLFNTYIEDKQEMLALENLKSRGFEIFSKKSIVDHDHIELIFKTYGRFHAYSYALRDQNYEEYSKLVEKFYNIYETFLDDGMFSDYLVDMAKQVLETLIPGEDDKAIKEFEKYQGTNILDIFGNSFTENCDYPAILHGDCWSNNMLFRYEEVDGRRRPCEMRLIDLQLIKLGSPACDLSYCFYSGARKDVFDNLNHYLKTYYESFSSFLRQLGSDPEKLFPFTVLQEHWKKYSKFGMIMAFGVIRQKLTYDDEIVDFKDGLGREELLSAFAQSGYNEEEFKKRIRELILHMSEIGAL